MLVTTRHVPPAGTTIRGAANFVLESPFSGGFWRPRR
jgi:hypothetical protein